MGKAVNNLVDIIRDIIQEEIDKEDDVVLCQVDQKKDDDHYDLNLVSSPNVVVHNITNMTPFQLNRGDYVYTYKIKNQLSNSFIINKIIPYVANKYGTGSKIYQAIVSAFMGYTVDGTTESDIICGSDEYNILGYSED